MLLLETCYDALNCRAALHAINQLEEEKETMVPVMVSVTVNNHSGCTFTGQTLEEIYASIQHYPILSFGVNCSFGVANMRPIIERIASQIPKYISFYPNAGLPNALGEYHDTPDFIASHIKAITKNSLLNIVGGCCGTTPEHIQKIAQSIKSLPPHTPSSHAIFP